MGRTAGRSAETQAARVPELRTVHYTFFAPNAGDELSEPGRQGLVRTELDFETPLEPNAARPAQAPLREAADVGEPHAERPRRGAGIGRRRHAVVGSGSRLAAVSLFRWPRLDGRMEQPGAEIAASGR